MKKIVILLGILLVSFFAVSSYAYKQEVKELRLPPDTNLIKYLEERPNAYVVLKFVSDGKDYVYVVGRYSSWQMISLPSGPPAYIFDERGNLVDWTPDTGDVSFGKDWGNRNHPWGSPDKAVRITVDEARQLIKP